MGNFTKFLKLSFVMAVVSFLYQGTYAQVDVTCQSASGCILEVPADPGASLYVLASGDCSIVGSSTDGNFPADDLAGDYCYYTASYSDASAAAVASALATGCVDDLVTLGEGDADITVTEFCNVSVTSNECEDFQVIHSAICSPPDANGDRVYQVLLVISGGDAGANGYAITDDQTGQSFGPIAGPSITFDPVATGTGFSYTVSVVDNPTCSVTVGESNVDCITTEVDLVRFNASVEANGNQINWVTATESNAKLFIVEHSANGVDFAQVGTVGAAGNSNVSRDYNFLHTNTVSGVHFYRLKEVDVEGNIRVFTETISVNRIVGLTINNVYPVPTVNMVNVDFSSNVNETVVVRVIDIAGKVLDQQNFTAAQGMNNISIDATPYAVGNYFVTISNSSTTVVEKFVKN